MKLLTWRRGCYYTPAIFGMWPARGEMLICDLQAGSAHASPLHHLKLTSPRRDLRTENMDVTRSQPFRRQAPIANLVALNAHSCERSMHLQPTFVKKRSDGQKYGLVGESLGGKPATTRIDFPDPKSAILKWRRRGSHEFCAGMS